MCQVGGPRCPGTLSGRALSKLYRQRKTAREAGESTADTDASIAALRKAVAVYGKDVEPLDLPVPEAERRVMTMLSDTLPGATPIVVGGSVRDALFGTAPKDFDVEVHGATLDEVADALRRGGARVDEVGKQFGVLKVNPRGHTGEAIDVSVPRRENVIGAGHRGFEVLMEPMTLEQACQLRDFTVNALAYDPEHEVVVDTCGGLEDLRRGVLRAVSEKFAEDPLRVLRGFGFAGRYGMRLDPDTAALCEGLRPRFDELSTERVQIEWDKFFAKSAHPSAGVAALKAAGWDDTLPGLRDALSDPGCAESLDRLSAVLQADRPAVGAALIATRMTGMDRGDFLRATVVGDDNRRIAHDLARLSVADVDTPQYRRELAHRLAGRGFTFSRARDYAAALGSGNLERLCAAACDEGLSDGPEPPLIQGRDVLAISAGRKPGPWVGELVKAALGAQHRRAFADRDGALSWLRSEIAS